MSLPIQPGFAMSSQHVVPQTIRICGLGGCEQMCRGGYIRFHHYRYLALHSNTYLI